ncbi:MAG: hypothetical protein ACE5JH_07435 [Acidobacteriota bacterium]
MTRGRKALTLFVPIVAVLAIGLSVRLVEERLEGRVRRAIESRSSERIGGEVRVGGVELSLLPPTIGLREVLASKRGNRGSRADATFPDARLRAGILTFLGLGRGPVRIELERPEIRLVLAEGRGIAPEGAGGWAAALRPTEVPDGSTLAIRDGRAILGVVHGPRAELAGIDADARWAASRGEVVGRGEFAGGSLRLAGTDWPGLHGEADFSLGAPGLRLGSLSIRGDGVAAAGDLLLAGDRGAEGSLQFGVDAARLAALLPGAAAVKGRIETSLTGEWRDGALHAEGDVSAVALSLRGIRLDSLRCDLSIDDEIRAQGIRAHLFGGQASGSLRVRIEPGRLLAEADLSVDGVALDQLLEYAGWTGPDVLGTLHYRGHHRFSSDGLETLRGSGVLDAVGHLRTSDGADLPIEITAKVATRGTTVDLSGGVIRAGSARGSFSGRVRRGEGIRLRLSGATGDISEILPLFRTGRSAP